MTTYKFITKFLRWTFWKFLYFFRFTLIGRRPRDFDEYYLWRIQRIGFPPWWKFRPFVHPWPFDSTEKVFGREVLWSNENHYATSRVPLEVELYVTMDDERVVGFSVTNRAIEESLERSKRGLSHG